MLSQVIGDVSPPDRVGEPKERFLRFRELVNPMMVVMAMAMAKVFFFMVVVAIAVVVVRIGGFREESKGAVGSKEQGLGLDGVAFEGNGIDSDEGCCCCCSPGTSTSSYRI